MNVQGLHLRCISLGRAFLGSVFGSSEPNLVLFLRLYFLLFAQRLPKRAPKKMNPNSEEGADRQEASVASPLPTFPLAHFQPRHVDAAGALVAQRGHRDQEEDPRVRLQPDPQAPP